LAPRMTATVGPAGMVAQPARTSMVEAATTPDKRFISLSSMFRRRPDLFRALPLFESTSVRVASCVNRRATPADEAVSLFQFVDRGRGIGHLPRRFRAFHYLGEIPKMKMVRTAAQALFGAAALIAVSIAGGQAQSKDAAPAVGSDPQSTSATYGDW